jgi:hypothetical protein
MDRYVPETERARSAAESKRVRKVTRANIGAVMKRLFDSGIEVSVTWGWEGAATYRIEGCAPVQVSGVNHVAEAIQAIVEQALARYPDSEFSKWWRGGAGVTRKRTPRPPARLRGITSVPYHRIIS